MILKTWIPERIAVYGLIITLSTVTVFHLLVLTGLIPFEIVWGGRLEDRSQMLIFETASVFINILMFSVVAVRAGMVKINISKKFIYFLLWSMSLLFMLNTIGNLFSNNELERMIFTPLTLILAIFTLRLALK